MKVKELCALLSKVDSDLDVVLAKDEEGNEFSLLADIGAGHY